MGDFGGVMGADELAPPSPTFFADRTGHVFGDLAGTAIIAEEVPMEVASSAQQALVPSSSQAQAAAPRTRAAHQRELALMATKSAGKRHNDGPTTQRANVRSRRFRTINQARKLN